MIKEWRRIFDDLTGAPAPPNIIKGSVFINNELASDGLLLQGVINGQGRAKTNLKQDEYNGNIFNFMLSIPNEGLHASEMGSLVEFYLNDVRCNEVYTIESYGAVVDMELNVKTIPILPTVVDIDSGEWRENLKTQLNGIVDDMPEINSVKHLPILVYGKRLPLSRRYMSEWITPDNLYVENAVLRILYGISDMNDPHDEPDDDEKFRHLYSVICRDIHYLYDERVYGVDYWQDPEETLMRLAGDCEDTSFVMLSLALSAGIPREKVRMCLGSLELTEGIFGHAWIEYLVNGVWKLAETTLDDEIESINDLPDVPDHFTREILFNDIEYTKYNESGNSIQVEKIMFDDLKYSKQIKIIYKKL